MQRFSPHPSTDKDKDSHCNSWFPVSRRTYPVPSFNPDYLANLRRELDEDPSVHAQDVDHRHISPWLATTRWHLWLSDLHEDCDPVAMVSYPDSKQSDQWSIVIPYIRRYMQEAYDLIPISGELCCQILNTDTMTK